MLSKTDYHPIEIEPVWVHCKCTIQMALRLTGLQEIESICGMKIRFDHGSTIAVNHKGNDLSKPYQLFSVE